MSEALERGDQPDPNLELTPPQQPKRPTTASLRPRRRNPHARGTLSHLTPREREEIKDILRELLAENALPPKRQLAQQLEVSATTLYKFLNEIHQEQPSKHLN